MLGKICLVDQLYRMGEYNRDVVEIGIKFARANIYGTRSEQFLRHKCGRNPNKIRSCKYYGTPSGQILRHICGRNPAGPNEIRSC